MTKYYIGIDGGATNIKAGIVDNRGKMLEFLSVPTQSKSGKKIVAKNVIATVDKLLSNKYKISGIGLAWPSKINVPISSKELGSKLSKKYNLSVHEANDAALFAFGEKITGQGQKKNTILGITLGTGVGSGLIIMDNILNPEFGHTNLNPKGPKCSCGKKGCFEEYAGARALKKLIKKYQVKAKDGEELYELTRKKNKKALKLWGEYGKQLAWGLNLANITFNPDIIILGGKISKAYSFFAPSMKQEMHDKNIIIKKSKLKNAAIIGAALYAKQNIK